MEVVDFIHRFNLQDHFIFNEEIGPLFPNQDSFVPNLKRLFLNKPDVVVFEFMR